VPRHILDDLFPRIGIAPGGGELPAQLPARPVDPLSDRPLVCQPERVAQLRGTDRRMFQWIETLTEPIQMRVG
jgi:hypothetical protein